VWRALAELFTIGVEVDWAAVAKQTGLPSARSVPLPTYPFRPRLESAANKNVSTTGSGLQSSTDLLYQVRWTPSNAKPGDESLSGTWIVFDDGSTLGKTLRSRREFERCRIVTITCGSRWEQISDTHFQIDPTDAEHYHRIFASIDKGLCERAARRHAVQQTATDGQIRIWMSRSSPPTFFLSFGPRRWAARANWRRPLIPWRLPLAGFAADRPIRYAACRDSQKKPNEIPGSETAYERTVQAGPARWNRISSAASAARPSALRSWVRDSNLAWPDSRRSCWRGTWYWLGCAIQALAGGKAPVVEDELSSEWRPRCSAATRRITNRYRRTNPDMDVAKFAAHVLLVLRTKAVGG